MRITGVKLNNRRREFELACELGTLSFPYAKAEPMPTQDDRIVEAFIDEELAGEAVTYRLASGAEGFVHIEMARDYHREPGYMRAQLLHKLTLEAHTALDRSHLSKREITRRLDTSPAQLYRLLDPANYSKSVDGMLELLAALGCEVDVAVHMRDRVNLNELIKGIPKDYEPEEDLWGAPVGREVL
ncbi:MAG: hypothetical protein Q7W51_05995 [Coriobacteriia bacterium]|nr:hypothetical protein [Coriobacteriia bacterium]